MKYFVVQRDDEESRHLTQLFHQLASERGMEHDNKNPDIVLSIGGDGTMLEAFQLYKHKLEKIAFVGLHTGHLGFFADWKRDEIHELVSMMASTALDSQTIVQYPIVEIELETKNGKENYLALNEFTLKGVDRTLVAQLYINDQMLEMFRGDGICISSPVGSTAYNKSLGGAILHPSIEALQIAEIASINNRVFRTIGSSLILPKHHHCDIFPREQQNLLVTIDHRSILRNDLISVRCIVSPKKVNFARLRPFPFWSRVREAFISFEIGN
ncbi:MAG: NAD kinase [Paenibacillus sp. RIFOXYA1_FULL_44_5]|nr:MAG: NAD kinase [Paenibacillus sp. RIFOXYA1_FULL_44_5]